MNVVKDEVVELKQVGAIKEVFYPEWLANTMVAKKKTRKWCVCVDHLMDAIIGHHWMSFWMLPKATTRYPWLWTIKRGRVLSLLLGITITR